MQRNFFCKFLALLKLYIQSPKFLKNKTKQEMLESFAAIQAF